MLRGCFANSFCQRLCSGLSWAEAPYERAMAKLKVALSSPPAPAVGVRGTRAGPGRWHRSTFVTLLEVPFPKGAAKATLEVLPRRGQTLPQHRGNTRASASRWELLGLRTLLVGTGFAVFIGISTALTFVVRSSPRLSRLRRYRLQVWSVKCREQANVF